MVEYARDPEDLKQAVLGYRVRGYPVVVPVFGAATIDSSSRTRDKTFYRVNIQNTLPFHRTALEFNWDDTKRDLKEWTEEVPTHLPDTLRVPVKILPPEIWDELEAGNKVSWRDVMKVWLRRAGCLDGEEVVCFDFSEDQIQIPLTQIRPGMMVQFMDQGIEPRRSYESEGAPLIGWGGRVVGIEPDREDGTPVILLEQIEPVPFLAAPEAISLPAIRPGFYSARTWVLGKDLYTGMQRFHYPIPKGQFHPEDPYKRLYYLDEPMDLAEIERFARERYPQNPQAFYQGMTMFLLPIHPERLPGIHKGGFFRPLPERTDVITFEEESEL